MTMNAKGFGWWKQTGSSTRFDPKQGIDYERISEFSNLPMLKYGNDFQDQYWLDHTQTPHNNWYFIDNPELPHLVYPNPANSLGHKSWCRVVPHAILTQESTYKDHSDRINTQLRDHSGGTITSWQDIVQTRRVYRTNSRRVLLTPSSPNCYTYYYKTQRALWIEEVSALVRSLGYEPVVWNKPARRARTLHPDTRLYTRLLEGDVLCTVSQHSVAALETLTAGVPAVVTGPHPCGDMATPALEFFTDGWLRTPTDAEIDWWIGTAILANTRHKTELREGTWQE
jgi:hypothetical protein